MFSARVANAEFYDECVFSAGIGYRCPFNNNYQSVIFENVDAATERRYDVPYVVVVVVVNMHNSIDTLN